jgi:ribosomal protein S18 acetylase RimI-like enzyme
MSIVCENKIKIFKMDEIHLESCFNIEKNSNEQNWDKFDFLNHIKRRNCGGYVISLNEIIVGFLAYEKNKKKDYIFVWNLVIDPLHRKKGLATILLNHIKSLVQNKKTTIQANIREKNIEAHSFFKKMGFSAWGISKEYFFDEVLDVIKIEDAYCFTNDLNGLGEFQIMDCFGEIIKNISCNNNNINVKYYRRNRK